jgi:hypothetical protein
LLSNNRYCEYSAWGSGSLRMGQNDPNKPEKVLEALGKSGFHWSSLPGENACETAPCRESSFAES